MPSDYDETYAGDTGGGYVAPIVVPPAAGSPLGTIWPDGTNVELGTAIGSILGTHHAQKLAFWGSPPVVRPAALPVSGAGAVGAAGAAYTATEQTLINALVTLAANQKARLDDLETKLQSIGVLT